MDRWATNLLRHGRALGLGALGGGGVSSGVGWRWLDGLGLGRRVGCWCGGLGHDDGRLFAVRVVGCWGGWGGDGDSRERGEGGDGELHLVGVYV